MFGVFAREKAEAVVVLRCEDDSAAAGIFQNFYPLVGVDAFRTEVGRTFCAFAPFDAGKGVHSEVYERVIFKLLQTKLKSARSDCCQPFNLRTGKLGAVVAFVPCVKAVF